MRKRPIAATTLPVRNARGRADVLGADYRVEVEAVTSPHRGSLLLLVRSGAVVADLRAAGPLVAGSHQKGARAPSSRRDRTDDGAAARESDRLAAARRRSEERRVGK